jgi:uncharacterized membrane protein
MTRYLTAYAVMLVLFPALDFVWIGTLARGLYHAEIGPLLAPTPNLGAAIAFYAIYAAGVLIFAVAPGLERGEWRRVLGMAALFGIVAYATYDLTNLATLKGFTTKLGLVDMAWGTTMTAIVASLGFLVAERLGPPA